MQCGSGVLAAAKFCSQCGGMATAAELPPTPELGITPMNTMLGAPDDLPAGPEEIMLDILMFEPGDADIESSRLTPPEWTMSIPPPEPVPERDKGSPPTSDAEETTCWDAFVIFMIKRC